MIHIHHHTYKNQSKDLRIRVMRVIWQYHFDTESKKIYLGEYFLR